MKYNIQTDDYFEAAARLAEQYMADLGRGVGKTTLKCHNGVTVTIITPSDKTVLRLTRAKSEKAKEIAFKELETRFLELKKERDDKERAKAERDRRRFNVSWNIPDSSSPTVSGMALARVLVDRHDYESGVDFSKAILNLTHVKHELLVPEFFKAFLTKMYEINPGLMPDVDSLEWESPNFPVEDIKKLIKEFNDSH
jgi:hypothetical protein